VNTLLRLLVALLVLLGLLLWPATAYWYTEWLWFLELGYPQVFWTPFLSRLLVGGVVFAFVFALLSLNARPFLRRWTRPEILELHRDGGRFRPRAPSPWPRRVVLGACAGIAFLAALANTGQWTALQQFLHAQPAGVRDPIFGLDLSAYLLRLPFWRFLVDLTWGWLLFTLVGVVVGYLLDTATLAIRGVWALPSGARAHISVLLARDTLENIRLWDYRPLLETYRQLQSLRAYYTFSDVDIDRYWVRGRQQQLMLAVRELEPTRLPPQARTWVNQHLVYTHGYGVVAAPVHRVSAEGLPELWVRDIPPRAEFSELQLHRPEVYFGELTRHYVIVDTRVPEFDYPRGDENVTTRYQGRAGIPLRGALRRLAFATRFGDARILLSTDLTPSSRVLFARAVPERLHRLAPFLRYDRDPYAVVADGRLFWIVDAYTTSDRYPYSQPVGSFNYIRNSVKAVVDAYHGTVRFYLADPSDPVARVYARIFPGLFQPLSELPPSLRAHLRYPVDLFEVQAHVYATYHMRDPQVFYNREDSWAVANEIFADRPQPVEPYYVTLRLPGAESARPEFVLILPMTPQRRDNMVAWLAARNDPPHLGELWVFTFPKDRVVFGPMQIESRINQDPSISQQLTLWNQQGSRVIRGNLLVVPVQRSLLYVEPLFLQAERSQLPELRRVVVTHGPRVAMAPTLEEALAASCASSTAGYGLKKASDAPAACQCADRPGPPPRSRTPRIPPSPPRRGCDP
jgi:uncharacterized membrane protein (UPF0182 family)